MADKFNGKMFRDMLAVAVPDQGLAKHAQARSPEEGSSAIASRALTIRDGSATSNIIFSNITTSGGGAQWFDGSVGQLMSGTQTESPAKKKPSVLKRMLRAVFPGKTPMEKAEPELLAIFHGAEELQELQSDEATLRKRVADLKITGQIALSEKLEEEIPTRLMEQKLLRSGFDRYIQVVALSDFFDRYGETFTASWVRNFLRPMPQHAVEQKLKADAMMVFDCYLLIHPHPHPKAILAAPTRKEKEEAKKRDPILLGYVLKSDRLYYIDSWIDPNLSEDLDLDRFNKLISATIQEGQVRYPVWGKGGVDTITPVRPAAPKPLPPKVEPEVKEVFDTKDKPEVFLEKVLTIDNVVFITGQYIKNEDEAKAFLRFYTRRQLAGMFPATMDKVTISDVEFEQLLERKPTPKTTFFLVKGRLQSEQGPSLKTKGRTVYLREALMLAAGRIETLAAIKFSGAKLAV